MYIEEMPGCCKATVMCGFGGGEFYDPPEKWGKSEYTINLAEAVEYLNQLKRQGVRVVIANTVSNQPSAEEMLEELGFYSQPIPMPAGGGRYMNTWIMPLNEWEG